ncbi:hypothetical protein TRIUR3_01734 [Triticum urartu]|uniref:DUF642 domain-containing protein n=1 Tax=Triticum urartu TaxID=4572 RepID=M7ZIM5_TRIUA|nr:hypothetical protein TRIUR3_01734 [Triticum urartu]
MVRAREMVQGPRCVALLLLVCMAALVASDTTDGLLPNGNFEEAPDRSQMDGTRVTGRYAIPRPPSDRQQLVGPPGTHYAITFSAARTCAQAEKLNVTVGAQSGELPIQTVYTSSGWDSYSWAFEAKESGVTLTVHNPGYDEDAACGPVVDSFAIRTLLPPQSNEYNMLKNGDFEEGPYICPSTSCGVMVPPMDEDSYSPLFPWVILSSTKSVRYVDAAHYAVPQGARAVQLVFGAESALVQEVCTVPGVSYRMEFSVGDAADGCTGSLAVEAYAAGGRVTVPYESQGTGGFTRGVLEFTATEDRTRVVFVSASYNMKSDGTVCGPVVDDASLVCAQSHARRLLL